MITLEEPKCFLLLKENKEESTLMFLIYSKMSLNGDRRGRPFNFQR